MSHHLFSSILKPETPILFCCYWFSVFRKTSYTIFVFLNDEKSLRRIAFILLSYVVNKHFVVHFRRNRPVHFLSEGRKYPGREEKRDEKVFNSRHSRNFFFVNTLIKVLYPPLYLELARKQTCFPPRKTYKEEKRKK